MPQKLSAVDSRRVAIFERFVKNANHLLNKKSAKEINKIIDDQDGFLRGIKDVETRDRLLADSKSLRNTALDSLNHFDSVMKRLKSCEKILGGKTPQEITELFDDVDKDISKIPGQHVRQLTQKLSSYWKSRWLDEYYINSSKSTLDKVSEDKSFAGTTIEEVEMFFIPLQKNIGKISNEETRSALFNFSEYHKKDAIHLIELSQQPYYWEKTDDDNSTS